GQARHADLPNIAEALRDLGSEQFFRLESSLRVLSMHVLKWDCQPSRRSRSWALTIKIQRNAVRRLLDRSSSLKSRLAEAMISAFEDARIDAAKETGLDEAVFPLACPYSFDDLMTREMAWPPQD